jgi:hypothetical protein
MVGTIGGKEHKVEDFGFIANADAASLDLLDPSSSSLTIHQSTHQ